MNMCRFIVAPQLNKTHFDTEALLLPMIFRKLKTKSNISERIELRTPLLLSNKFIDKLDVLQECEAKIQNIYLYDMYALL